MSDQRRGFIAAERSEGPGGPRASGRTSGPRFAFLVYVARSGSTLLSREIAVRCPDVHALPEFQLPDLLLHLGESRVRGLDAARLAATFDLDPQLGALGVDEGRRVALARELAGRGIAEILRRIEREARAPDRSAPRVALLKKGALIERLPDLYRAFPDAVLLHVVRDPRAVANSMMRSRDPYEREARMGRGDPWFIGRYWSRFQERVERARAGPLPVVEVSYEQLVRDPAATVAAVAAGLGLPPPRDERSEVAPLPEAERELHALADRAPLSGRAEAWRAELGTWQGLTVEAATRRARAGRGYPSYYFDARSAPAALAGVARGLAFHATRTVGHFLGAARFYATRPRRLGMRLRRWKNSSLGSR